MRPLLCAALIAVSGVVAGVFASGGAARTSTPGDGCLVVQGGYGKVVITLTRGVVFGRFVSGQLSYSDLGLDKTQLPTVNVSSTKTKDHLWSYGTAENVRFRATGPTRLIVYADQMDLSVAGKGTATIWRAGLGGAPSTIQPPSNAFSVDAASFCGANFQKMPQVLTKVQISSPVVTGQ
jgi:hypothetical protein